MDEAYKSVQTLHGTRYPAAVVMIDVDPSQVDVNVSPTKTEVRFTREGDIYAAVYKAVQEALMAGGLVPTIMQKMNAREVRPPPATIDWRGAGARHARQEAQPSLLSVPSRPAGNTRQEPRDTAAFHEAYQERARQAFDDDPFEGSGPPAPYLGGRGDALARVAATPPLQKGRLPRTPPTGADYRGHNLDTLRVLAQTRNMYILAQTDDALVLIDQHIAHERVLYEKLLAGAEGAGGGRPDPAADAAVHAGTVQARGAGRREAPGRPAAGRASTWSRSAATRSSSAPSPPRVAQKHLKAQGGPEEILREIVDEMVEKTVSRRLLLPAEEVLITASCKMAVKAGDPLSFEEMNALVADLLKSDNPYTCPHGRPIIVELPNGDLDRKFGR